MPENKKFIPALNKRSLTFLYDPLIRFFMPENEMKRQLIKRADIRGVLKVLDIGCGTGTLTIMAKKANSDIEAIGLDPDPEILRIARNKAREANVEIQFNEASSMEMPYPDGCFDRVLSSLMIHHLNTEEKIKTLAEVHRVLKQGGSIHILDFGKPKGNLAKFVSFIMRRLEETADNIDGLLPKMLTNAGFAEIEKTHDFSTIFGTMSLFRASRVNKSNTQ